MAKKSKDDAPNPNSVSNRDVLQRLNFLYQASVLLGTSGSVVPEAPKPIPPTVKGKKRKEEMRKRNKERHSTACADLSRTYVKSMKTIGQKTNTRMDPTVKRTLCKGCNLVLVPGATALVRVHGSKIHGHIVNYTCTSCHTARRIPAPPTLLPSTEDATASTAPVAGPSTAQDEPPSDVAMDIDQQNDSSTAPVTRKRKGPKPRLPPLFQRDVGHVIFRGNERLPVEPS